MKHIQLWGIAFGTIPFTLASYFIAKLINPDNPGDAFWYVVAGLVALKTAAWLWNALWGWLWVRLTITSVSKDIAARMDRCGFPVYEHQQTGNLYLEEVIADESVPITARLDAAQTLGSLQGIASTAGIVAYLRSVWVVGASEQALRRLRAIHS